MISKPAISFSLAVLVATSGCSGPNSGDAANAAINSAMEASAQADAALAHANVALAGATDNPVNQAEAASICKAAMAELFGHSPKIMKAKAQSAGIIRVSYKRPDDGKQFKNDCQLQGSRVMWRSVDVAPGSGPGRWRNNPADEAVTFKVVKNTVELRTTYSDGSTVNAIQPLL